MKKIAFIAASIFLAGCSNLDQLNDPERFKQVTGIDKHSSYPVMRREYFERINLLELVDPEQKAASDFGTSWNSKIAQNDPNGLNEFGAKYDLVLARFRQRTDISDDTKRRLRNSIQERILSASMSRCNVFKTFLRRDQADQNFLLGSMTTAAGVLGAVLPGANASHNLAGAAGLFSGIRSEYNQAYYSNLAAHVIVRGIETKQELVYGRIQREGQSKSIDLYPLEAAIKDAVYWDGLCSVVVGLDQAAASIDATNEPGLEAATRTMLRARIAKEALDLPRDQLLKPGTLENFGKAEASLGMSLVGSTRGEPIPADSEIDVFVEATKMTDRLNVAVNTAANGIEQAVNARRKILLDELTKTAPGDVKSITDQAPKEGAVADAIKAAIKSKILDPLKLDVCYSNVAAPAVKKRLAAVQARDKATTDEEKVSAQYAIKDAERAIQAARDQLHKNEQLVNLDIATYQKQRLDAVSAVKDAKNLADPKVLAPDPVPSASKGQDCNLK